MSTEDFTYRGMFIPKGTVVIINTYTMHNDPKRHPEPEKFNVSLLRSIASTRYS